MSSLWASVRSWGQGGTCVPPTSTRSSLPSSPTLRPARGWPSSQDVTAPWLLEPLKPTRAASLPAQLGNVPSWALALAAQAISILNL